MGKSAVSVETREVISHSRSEIPIDTLLHVFLGNVGKLDSHAH